MLLVQGVVVPGMFELGPKSLRAAATMGRPNGSLQPSPLHFITKHSKEPRLPQPGPPTHTKIKVKAPVPSRTDKPLMGLTADRNYVTTNAVAAILAKPGKLRPPVALATSRAGFGKVPAYLSRTKRQLAEEQAKVEEYVRLKQEEEATRNVTQLSEEERRELLAFLKRKWSEVNTAYQKMTFTIDTPSKARRKERYEAQLGELEADIRRLGKGQVVLVVDQ